MNNGNGNGSLKFWQLLERAEKLTQKNLSPASVLEILSAIELPPKSEYSSDEAQKFLEAIELIASSSVSLTDLKTIFLAKQVVYHIEDDIQKKTQDLASEVGQAMAFKQEELGSLWLTLLEMRLNEWSKSGLLDAIAQEARTRILKAKESGIPIKKDYQDWCVNQKLIIKKLTEQQARQKSSKGKP